MTKSQAKKKYGIEGTKSLRKQWSIAVLRGKTPNTHTHYPNTNPQREKFTKEEKIYRRITKKLIRMAA